MRRGGAHLFTAAGTDRLELESGMLDDAVSQAQRAVC